MKKLKVWQVILLVIFYPIGLCVLIYRIWKKRQIRLAEVEAKQTADELRASREAEVRRQYEERQAQKQADAEREAAFRRLFEDLSFKVVGVTFKNPDGHTRQGILRKIKYCDPPFDKQDIDITVEKGEYNGEPAFSVIAEGFQIGNIGRDDIPRLLSRWDTYVGVTEIDVTGGGRNSDGNTLNYGAVVRLRFKKVLPVE